MAADGVLQKINDKQMSFADLSVQQKELLAQMVKSSVIEQFEESFQTIQRQGREEKKKGPSGGDPARSPSPTKAGLVRRSSSFFGQNTEAIFDENLQSLESIKRSVSHSELASGA